MEDKEYNRVEYIMKCKHFADGVCVKKSGTAGIWHVTILCDANCHRMRNYDKKNGGVNEI